MNSSNHSKSIKLNKLTLAGAAVALAGIGIPAHANDYPIAIETVLVGDPNNSADSGQIHEIYKNGIGSVAYEYRIGTYMVTQSQYVQFLNAVTPGGNLYGLGNVISTYGNGIDYDGVSYFVITGYENRPVAGVSFWDAARFCNWMTNQKFNGTDETETGMYILGGSISDNASGIVRDSIAWGSGGVALPTADEWHKAAYYDGSVSDYWNFATTHARKQIDPMALDEMSTTYANYSGAYSYNLVDVDYFWEYPSYYGAVGMNGNLWEWATVDGSKPIRRGGAWNSGGEINLRSTGGDSPSSDENGYYNGFRIASKVEIVPVPEPSEFGLMGGAALGLLCLVRRRKRVRS